MPCKTFKRDLRLLLTPCKSREELRHWAAYYAHLSIPDKPVCPHHHAPMEYLWRSYKEPARDLVVWAPRGGGKTRLAAVSTLLDLIHKPGCAVRIIGGSFEQSLRMWEHLLPDLEYLGELWPSLRPVSQSARHIAMRNGASAAVLTQSQRAVRGLRVQKLRCDEVEMFDPEIWKAAQLVTRSISANGSPIRGAIEAISTHHKPAGLMSRIVEDATERRTPVLRWCLLEVLEKCPKKRDCDSCPLLEDCGGRAKDECSGFFKIDDAIAMKHRVSKEMWDTEVMCRRPSVEGCVFPNFNREVHARASGAFAADSLSLAIDFGFHNPFVCLWIADDGTNCHVIDEYVQSQRTIDDHVQQIEARPFGKVRRICCDPAGAGRNDQTAESNVEYFRRHGYKVHTKSSRIVNGIEMIRAALRPAFGRATLFIDPKCTRLIAALQQYSYADGGGELPVKDGTHDHLVDALRYFYVNRKPARIVVDAGRRY